MLGKLNEEEMDELLYSQVVGRIACTYGDFLYLVPISYAYDGKAVYFISQEGTKLNTMRKNPAVCFEVDDCSDMSNWKSVIAWGTFEELRATHARNHAIQLLLHRHLPFRSSIKTHLGKEWPFTDDDLGGIEGVAFRIVLHKKTGRFEYTSVDDPTRE